MRNSTTAPITGTITAGGTAINIATLPTQLLPRCINGTPEEARTANFKTPSGDVIIVGRGPSSYVTVAVNRDRVRAVTTNACGFVRVGISTAFQHTAQTSVRLPGETADRTIGSLTAHDAPICNQNILYVPANWLGS